MFIYWFIPFIYMKFCEIGVYHHDCWFTDAISNFPELHVREISGRVYQENDNKRIVKGVYKIISGKSEDTKGFTNQTKKNNDVLEVKPLTNDLVQVAWNAPVTSYDAVLNSGCTIGSSCYSKDGYEAYSLFAESPDNIKKLLSEMEQIGEVKLFSLKNDLPDVDKFGLTAKQKQAVAAAISMGYYEWPKKVNLEELAARIGMKRRALQENLRKAESKIMPGMLDELTGE